MLIYMHIYIFRFTRVTPYSTFRRHAARMCVCVCVCVCVRACVCVWNLPSPPPQTRPYPTPLLLLLPCIHISPPRSSLHRAANSSELSPYAPARHTHNIAHVDPHTIDPRKIDTPACYATGDPTSGAKSAFCLDCQARRHDTRSRGTSLQTLPSCTLSSPRSSLARSHLRERRAGAFATGRGSGACAPAWA